MSQILAPFQLLELNVISAQDLAPVGRNMRTYAVSWVHPDRKLSTRVDTEGHTHPTWNDKFVYRVDDDFLCSDTSAIMIEIYALHWFKDIHIGTVRVLVGNLAPPPSKPFHNNNRTPLGMRFVALQVRRPSGRPQGILNIGFTILDSSMRSMPLYTHNPSAVGYRHLMGEKDAYDSHNHLSPHVLAASGATPKPDLRRSKSDTSSMLAAPEPVPRQHHNRAVVKERNTKTKAKKSSSVVSGVDETSSVLSDDDVLPWKVKSGKASPDDILHVGLSPPHHNYDYNHVVQEVHNHNENENEIADSTVSEEEEEEEEQYQNQHVPVHYEVRPSPKPQFRNSPAPAQFKNSPGPQYMNSPAPQYKNSPAPHYKSSPAPQFKNSPAPHYKSSPAPHYKSSPAPHYKSSPAPHYKSSPAPQYKSSPAPQFKNSPAPQYMNSPKPQFKNSPLPQYMNSPKPQFKNSPMPQYMASPKPQFQNSPAVGVQQFRASPAISKFNPAAHRGTPMHPLGKVNGGGFEYMMTPRRSNLVNMGPAVITESELGPSPSEVAAAIARKPMVIDEGENSTVGGWSLDDESMEGLQSRLERWRTVLPPVIDRGELSSQPTTSTKASTKTSRHSRRHTDGGSGSGSKSGRSGTGTKTGLFSCFSKICGVECYVGCGGDPKGKKDRIRSRRHTPSASVDDSSSLL